MSVRRTRHAENGLTEDEREDLYAVFCERQWVVNLLTALIADLFFCGAYFGLAALNRHIASSGTHALIVLVPESVVWMFFAFFGAMTLSFQITLQIWALLAGPRMANLYANWAAAQPKSYRGGDVYYDSRRVFGWLAALIALPVGIFTALALPMRATVGPDVIRDCGYGFKSCEIYPIVDVRRITSVAGFLNSKGEFIHSPEAVVDFSDGRRWTTADWADFGKTGHPEVLDFLARKTGLPVGFDATTADLPINRR